MGFCNIWVPGRQRRGGAEGFQYCEFRGCSRSACNEFRDCLVVFRFQPLGPSGRIYFRSIGLSSVHKFYVKDESFKNVYPKIPRVFRVAKADVVERYASRHGTVVIPKYMEIRAVLFRSGHSYDKTEPVIFARRQFLWRFRSCFEG